MRSGRGVSELMKGGPWELSTVICADDSALGNTPEVRTAAMTAEGCETQCAIEGCTKGACIAGIDLQQSWP